MLKCIPVLVLVVPGCGDATGDADTGISCGPGTTLIGSQCVPNGDATTSGAGESTSSADESTSDGSADASTVDPATTADASSDSSSGGDMPTELDLQDVILHDNPPDLATWPITTTITSVVFSDEGVHVEFSKRDGEERWPDITPPDWKGPLQYTLGLAERIDGQWHASAAIQYWYGLEASGGNIAVDNQVAINWYYDARWGEMAGYQPTTGETIGVFVVAGNVRGVLDGSQSPAMERSNVVLVPMPDAAGATHDF